MSSNHQPRVRFAPSPTGFLHIGSLRTVLFNYLLAKKEGGQLILRLEDTDQKRKVEGAAEKLIEILDWLEIKFDEGPHLGGEKGPYIQSERLPIYQKYSEELLAKGGAYRCFCPPERLEEMRKKQAEAKKPPRYDRACRDLSEEEIEKKLAKGEKFAVRQKMPLAGEIKVYDELRGEITFQAEDLEDHILVKSDNMPTYHFASVADDHLMEITHVIRAEEWIPSFPKNILLYRAFGWPEPKFIHISLTLNKGGGKLSKRQGDVAVEDYRAKGYLKEALINFSVLLGWHPKGDREIFSLPELEKEFNWRNLGTSPAVFDLEKLDYFNGYYIRQKNLDDLTALARPFLEAAGLIEKNAENKDVNKISGEILEPDYLKKIVALEQERLKKISEIGERTGFFFFLPEYDSELLIWKNTEAKEIKNNLEKIRGLLEKIPEKEWTNDSLADALLTYLAAKGLKNGEYLWPLRVALSGLKASPGPFEIAEILGKEKTLERINKAVKKLSAKE